MSVADALKDLPSRNKDHFSKLNIETHNRSNNSRKSTYLSTKDTPPEQIIVTDRENILLRYLHQQWDKKTNALKKRQGEPNSQDEPSEKKPKLEHTLNSSTTTLTSTSTGATSTLGQLSARNLPGYAAAAASSAAGRSQGAARTNVMSRPPTTGSGSGAAGGNSSSSANNSGQSRSSVLYFN